MKRIGVLILILMVGIGNLFSQSNFVKGYVIENTNDTIYGYLDYKGELSNSKLCKFKNELDAEEIEYAPEDIHSYRFLDDKYYVSRLVKNENGEDELMFMEYLIDGIVDVFFYSDGVKSHFFIDPGDGRLTELTNESIEYFTNNEIRRKESKNYIGVLKYAFKESQSVSKKVENLSINRKSLIDIAKKYHNEVCTSEACVVYEKVLPKIRFLFGPIVGWNYNQLVLPEESDPNFFYEILYDHDFDNSYYGLRENYSEVDMYPTVGFFIKSNLRFANKQLYFQYEFTFNKSELKYNNLYTYTGLNSSSQLYEKIVLKQNAITNVGLIRYEFAGSNKIRPVIQAGGFFSFYTNVDCTYDLTRKSISYGDIPIYKSTESPFRKTSFGIDLGVGSIISITKKNDLNVDLRYQYGAGLHYGINSHRIFLNIGLLFGK